MPCTDYTVVTETLDSYLTRQEVVHNEDGSFSIVTKNISTGEIVSVDMTLKEE